MLKLIPVWWWLVALGAAGIVYLALFVPHGDGGTRAETACASSEAAFNAWLTGQSAVYGEDLNARYGIQSVTAECGDVTVNTLISEDAGALAEGACNVLSGATTAVPSVETVTVKYATGKNACYQWPGGPSNF